MSIRKGKQAFESYLFAFAPYWAPDGQQPDVKPWSLAAGRACNGFGGQVVARTGANQLISDDVDSPGNREYFIHSDSRGASRDKYQAMPRRCNINGDRVLALDPTK